MSCMLITHVRALKLTHMTDLVLISQEAVSFDWRCGIHPAPVGGGFDNGWGRPCCVGVQCTRAAYKILNVILIAILETTVACIIIIIEKMPH